MFIIIFCFVLFFLTDIFFVNCKISAKYNCKNEIVKQFVFIYKLYLYISFV